MACRLADDNCCQEGGRDSGEDLEGFLSRILASHHRIMVAFFLKSRRLPTDLETCFVIRCRIQDADGMQRGFASAVCVSSFRIVEFGRLTSTNLHFPAVP